tara:strand:- start:5243 stop:5440 length:198 start_codon:yes stop_codon:yes gene_type:complete
MNDEDGYYQELRSRKTGRKLSQEMREEIRKLYFEKAYGLSGVARKLGIHRTTVRRHVEEMKEAQG